MSGISYHIDYAEWVTTNYSRMFRMAHGVIFTQGYYGRTMEARDFLHEWLVHRSKIIHTHYNLDRAPIDFYCWMDMTEYYRPCFYRWERVPWLTDYQRFHECDPRRIEANGTGPEDEYEEIEFMHDLGNYINLIRYTPVRTNDNPELRIKILQEMLKDKPLPLRAGKVGNPDTKIRDVATTVGLSDQTLFYHLKNMRAEFHAFRDGTVRSGNGQW